MSKSDEGSNPWHTAIDLSQPHWMDYRESILQLQQRANPGSDLPSTHELQQLLSGDVVNHAEHKIRFVPSVSIPGAEYEGHIYRTGEVSTRENSWHDLFNALVWSCFPRMKAAMNALHHQQIQNKTSRNRGPVRDALTLFDECGVIVVCKDTHLLELLVRRDWKRVFLEQKSCWQEGLSVFVFGHGLLEKFLRPYKSLTAHALLVQADFNSPEQPRVEQQKLLDNRLAQNLLSGRVLHTTAELSPLPLMGIPGWWPSAEQNESFYTDRQVFRQPANDFIAPPILRLSTNSPVYQAIP